LTPGKLSKGSGKLPGDPAPPELLGNFLGWGIIRRWAQPLFSDFCNLFLRWEWAHPEPTLEWGPMGVVSGLVLVGWTQQAAFSLPQGHGAAAHRPPFVGRKDRDGGLGWKGGTARGGPGANTAPRDAGWGAWVHPGRARGFSWGALGSGRWPGVPGRSPPPVRGAPPRPAGPQPFPTPRDVASVHKPKACPTTGLNSLDVHASLGVAGSPFRHPGGGAPSPPPGTNSR